MTDWMNRSWKVTELDLGRGLVPAMPHTRITLGYEDGRIGGSGGCNRYFGGVEAGDDGSLRILGVGSTRMACLEPIMAQEQAFFDLLGRVDAVAQEEGRLELLAAGTTVLVFAELSGSPEGEWRLWGYNNGRQAIVTVDVGAEITARIEDGTISGSGGCNRYRAPCVIDGEAIEIGSAVTTRMACSPSVMEQEARFFGLLAEARSFRVRDGDTLELFGGEGERLLQFNRL
ncbi:MAG: META domain-containing protein [Acidimicrobiia bacterium]|jgi:heat shock protein HslJ